MTFVVSDQSSGSRLKVIKSSLEWRICFFFSFLSPCGSFIPLFLYLVVNKQVPIPTSLSPFGHSNVEKFFYANKRAGKKCYHTNFRDGAQSQNPLKLRKVSLNYGFFGVEVWGEKGSAAFLAQSSLLSETCQDHCSQSGW